MIEITSDRVKKLNTFLEGLLVGLEIESENVIYSIQEGQLCCLVKSITFAQGKHESSEEWLGIDDNLGYLLHIIENVTEIEWTKFQMNVALNKYKNSVKKERGKNVAEKNQ